MMQHSEWKAVFAVSKICRELKNTSAEKKNRRTSGKSSTSFSTQDKLFKWQWEINGNREECFPPAAQKRRGNKLSYFVFFLSFASSHPSEHKLVALHMQNSRRKLIWFLSESFPHLSFSLLCFLFFHSLNKINRKRFQKQKMQFLV